MVSNGEIFFQAAVKAHEISGDATPDAIHCFLRGDFLWDAVGKLAANMSDPVAGP